MFNTCTCPWIYNKMSEFQKIVQSFVSASQEKLQLNQQMMEFTESINYQIIKLYMQLMDSFEGENNKLMHINEQDIINIQKQMIRITSSESLCDYLRVSRHHLKRDYSIYSISESDIERVIQIIIKNASIDNKLREALKGISLQHLFSQIDFFSNGYIDSAAIFEFISHYQKNNEAFNEKNCAELIKMFKHSNNCQKIFIQDMVDFMEERTKTENISVFKDQQTQLNASPSISKGIKFSAMSQIQKNKIIPDTNKIIPGTTSSIILKSNEKCERIPIKTETSESYEQKLIRAHNRNHHYLKKVKQQISQSLPIPQTPLQSHLFQSAQTVKTSQLKFKFQLIGDLYRQKQKTILQMIEDNPKFTFLDGFGVIDQAQSNKVGKNEFFDFLSDCQIQVLHKKSTLFFERICNNEHLITYSEYLKVFKLNAVRSVYEKCSRRTPLICQTWSKDMRERYCKFIKSIIDIEYELCKLSEEMKKYAWVDIENFLKLMSDSQQMKAILGQKYDCLIGQVCQSSGEMKIQKIKRILRIDG